MHAIILVRGSHPYRRCSVPLKEFIVSEIYLQPYLNLVFDDDETGPADESKRTKRVQGCSRQIMEGGF